MLARLQPLRSAFAVLRWLASVSDGETAHVCRLETSSEAIQSRIARAAVRRRSERRRSFLRERQRRRRLPKRDPCPASLASQAIQYSAPDGIRTHAGAGLSRLPLPFGLRGPGYRTAGAILAAAVGQRDASTVGVAEAPPSLIRVSSGRLARSPVAMRSSMTTVASGRKCTGCTPVIRPVLSSRK